MSRRIKQKLGVFLTVAATVVALPILIPLALFTHHLDERRLLKAAKNTECPICNVILGEEALNLANTVRAKEIAGLKQSHPGVKFRLVRRYDAICTRCETRLRFEKSSQTFTAAKGIADVAN